MKFKYYTGVKLLLLVALSIFFIVGFIYTYNLYNSPAPEIQYLNEYPIENGLFRKVVYISGAIINPGVYNLDDGMRVIDLVDLAGGFSNDADTAYISKDLNLAAKLMDEQMVFIPSTSNMIDVDTSVLGLIDINTASISQLTTLPGIGEATAEKIIGARPFSTIEDLLNVSGIGESKFENIKSLIYVK